MSWNRPSDGRKVAGGVEKKNTLGHVILAAVLVAAIGILVVWFLFDNGKSQPVAVGKKNQCVHTSVKRPESAKVADDLASTSKAVEKPLRPDSAATSGKKEQIETDEQIRRKLSGENDIVAHNPADQIIMMLMTADPNTELAPLPDNAVSEEDFDKSLSRKIVIRDTDIERVKAVKQAIIDARQQIIELRKQGMTVNEILTEHRNVCNENLKLVANAEDEAQKLFEEGDLDAAAEYVTKVNEVFKDMGIRELALPQSDEQNEADAAEAEAIKEEADAVENEDLNRRVEEYKAQKAHAHNKEMK